MSALNIEQKLDKIIGLLEGDKKPDFKINDKVIFRNTLLEITKINENHFYYCELKNITFRNGWEDKFWLTKKDIRLATDKEIEQFYKDKTVILHCKIDGISYKNKLFTYLRKIETKDGNYDKNKPEEVHLLKGEGGVMVKSTSDEFTLVEKQPKFKKGDWVKYKDNSHWKDTILNVELEKLSDDTLTYFYFTGNSWYSEDKLELFDPHVENLHIDNKLNVGQKSGIQIDDKVKHKQHKHYGVGVVKTIILSFGRYVYDVQFSCINTPIFCSISDLKLIPKIKVGDRVVVDFDKIHQDSELKEIKVLYPYVGKHTCIVNSVWDDFIRVKMSTNPTNYTDSYYVQNKQIVKE